MKFNDNIQNYKNKIIKDQIKKYNKEKLKLNLPELNKDTKKLLEKEITNLIHKGKGLIALEDDNFLGYLLGYEIEEMWGSPSIYIPMYGHGIISGDAKKIYQKLYQKNSEIWVNKGYKQHAITLYSREEKDINTWFWLGFGLRCVDAIKDIDTKSEYNNKVLEINSKNIYDLEEIHCQHTNYYSKAPLFMIRNEDKNPIETLKKWLEEENHHIFAYYEGETPLGYMRIEEVGEQFITTDSKMMNITSAYVNPSYRGKKIGCNLLKHIEKWLDEKGYEKLGVDFESFNVLGSNFWTKYFNPYAYTVVRRMDG